MSNVLPNLVMVSTTVDSHLLFILCRLICFLHFFKPPFIVMGTAILLILRLHSGCIIRNNSISFWNHWLVDCSWNVMAYGDARKGKWKGNWRMEWVASTLHTTSERGVSSITTNDAHTLAASSRLNWRPRRFKWTLSVSHKRRNLVSARVPSHFNWPVLVI